MPAGIPSVTKTDLDALGAAAELQFDDSAAHHSYADWAREQEAEPACKAAIRYSIVGQPESLPAVICSCFPSHQCPSISEVQDLTRKG